MLPLFAFLSRYIDKVAHLLLCLSLVYILADYLYHHTHLPLWLCIVIAVVVAEVFSIGKELFDRKSYGLFDPYDLLADNIGIALAVTLFVLNICL